MGMSVGAARLVLPYGPQQKIINQTVNPGWTNFSPGDRRVDRSRRDRHRTRSRLLSLHGAGGARSLNPRIGIQYDANARTRLKALTRLVRRRQHSERDRV